MILFFVHLFVTLNSLYFLWLLMILSNVIKNLVDQKLSKRK